MLGIHLAGAGLDRHALLVPEQRLNLILEELLVEGLALKEAEDRRARAIARQNRPPALGDIARLISRDSADRNRKDRLDGGIAITGRRPLGPGNHPKPAAFLGDKVVNQLKLSIR